MRVADNPRGWGSDACFRLVHLTRVRLGLNHTRGKIDDVAEDRSGTVCRGANSSHRAFNIRPCAGRPNAAARREVPCRSAAHDGLQGADGGANWPPHRDAIRADTGHFGNPPDGGPAPEAAVEVGRCNANDAVRTPPWRRRRGRAVTYSSQSAAPQRRRRRWCAQQRSQCSRQSASSNPAGSLVRLHRLHVERRAAPRYEA